METIHGVGEFDAALSNNRNILAAHFRAEWAPQCAQVETSLLELSKNPDFKDLQVVNVEAESVPQISLKFGITAVPTVIIFRKQLEVDRVNGANPAELVNKLKKQVGRLANERLQTTQADFDDFGDTDGESLEDRLKRLVNAAPCMIFMKGSPDEAKCGFSRTLVSILNNHQADYKHFDILSDEVVRQELKKFSNWPTYPQVYVKGDLVGGLDIIKEMEASGELDSILPKKQDLNQRLSALTKSHPVMIFMKGDPRTPRCGFSKTLMEIMAETGVAFKTFDILQDEDVRQGLKVFSKWPTFPQVYVNGELIGGLDIVKELKASGDLISTLQGA
ncbi:unnamed protein product [Notodromas monacha]|uniref:Glutaredoxin-3 n=1 Tax=Notodromas monacha TaxID=399045 RepID=A0A7R9BJS0_9CRUS|nr:unnamed protein product [Notodromas monacha]CAG0915425.1 unnamed protein product [Notodromas monacha]